jgi:protein-ribulosamine 3-kinase
MPGVLKISLPFSTYGLDVLAFIGWQHEHEHKQYAHGLEPMQLLSQPLRAPIEEIVSEYKRREWRVKSARDMSEFACHHCAILADDAFAVFAKYSEEPGAAKQFEIELNGLQYLAKNTGVMIPTPIGIVAVENGTLLIIEALKAVERGPLQWRQMGKTLARIHRVKSDRCGFHRHGFVGPLDQDNTPTRDWMTFYREHRLWPRLRLAIDSGNLPSSVASQVEKLIARLPELCGPEIMPALLHGDAQQNNFISTAEGTFVIDPAVYYGNPEIDLALIDSFQPVPDDVLNGYREEMPIDPGFFERRDLWRVSIYLAAVTVEGPMRLYRLTSALQRYL